MLLKIRAPPGPTRTEVMQLIDIFRARVVDVSDRSLTIAVTGDAGKVRSRSLSSIERLRLQRAANALMPHHRAMPSPCGQSTQHSV